MNNNWTRRLYAVSGASLLFGVAAGASAADWHFDPKITLNAQSDDNHRLTDVPGEEIEVFGAELDGQLTILAESQRGSFRLIPRLRSSLYPGDEEEETNDQYLRLLTERRGERSEATFDADYSRVETLGRYFPGAGIDDDDDLGEPDPGDDISRSTNENRRDRLEAEPRVAFELTERVGLELGINYLDVSYDEQVDQDREDYSDIDGAVGLSFRTSPNRTLTVTAGVSRYEPDDSDGTDSHSLDATWSNRISETSQVFVRGGASRVESDDGLGGSDWTTGFNGGAGVRWSFEVTELFLDVNRYLDPNPSGRVVERDQLRFELRRQVSPLTMLYLNARGIRDARARENDLFLEREYVAASAGFAWRMTQKFTLGGGYRYVWRQYDGDPNDAVANEFHLGITYEPHRR